MMLQQRAEAAANRPEDGLEDCDGRYTVSGNDDSFIITDASEVDGDRLPLPA